MIVAVIIVLITISLVVRSIYMENAFYAPKGPSFQTPEQQQTNGYPVKQRDAGADAARKFEIEMYDAALKRFYAANKRSPQSLDELVSTGLIKKVTQDMVTKQPPTYNPQDFEHGCRVEYVLSNGATIAAYCK